MFAQDSSARLSRFSPRDQKLCEHQDKDRTAGHVVKSQTVRCKSLMRMEPG